jgi:hypothetical protein
MCFTDYDDDYRDTYKTKVSIRNGERYVEETYHPHYGMSRRRRYDFGGSYYPARYYTSPPSRFPARFSQSGAYPRGVVSGGYSRGVVPGGYDQRMIVSGGIGPRGYSNGGFASGVAYGTGYHVGARAVMPVNAAMVSLFLFPLIVLRLRCRAPAFLLHRLPAVLPHCYWFV